MLVIDETISSPIAHVESIPAVKVQSVQGEDLIITLTKNGTLNYHNLSNFGYISSHILDQDINSPATFQWDENKPTSLHLDDDNRTWIANGCHITWRDPNAPMDSWQFGDICTGMNDPIISVVQSTNQSLLVGTQGDGFVMIDRLHGQNLNISFDKRYIFFSSTSQSTVSDVVNSIGILGDQILIAGNGG